MTKETSLVLRVCRPDLTSHNGFQWPDTVGAEVTAPDWKNDGNCGHGLHGWLFGAGEHDCIDYHSEQGAKWMVLEVKTADIVMLGGKVKFPSCVVRHTGDRKSATDFLLANEDLAKPENCIGAEVHVGDNGTATAGHYGTATAGHYGTATAGYRGTATAGDCGTATAGERGTATAGESGTATAGYRGTATAGHYGTATAGYRGTATAGYRGTATAGHYGTLVLSRYDAKAMRYRLVVGYVGEDGIEPNVAYRLDDAGKFVNA